MRAPRAARALGAGHRASRDGAHAIARCAIGCGRGADVFVQVAGVGCASAHGVGPHGSMLLTQGRRGGKARAGGVAASTTVIRATRVRRGWRCVFAAVRAAGARIPTMAWKPLHGPKNA
jgi:hypothetical protein